jgi:hypothetical protein
MLSNQHALIEDFKARTNGRMPELWTSDERNCYPGVLLKNYGISTPQERQGTRGRFPNPILTPPPDLVYATVHKQRQKGRVIDIEIRQIFGTPPQLQEALTRSSVSRHVNTAFVERFNGTTRHRNSRQARKTYAFSKDWDCHEDQAFLTLVGYNFCWAVRTLGVLNSDGRRQKRSPAMAQGITDHVWTVKEFLRYQIPMRK